MLLLITILIFQTHAFIGGGKEDKNKPFVINYEMGEGDELGSCTGTHLSPEWIITAAHCLTDVKVNKKEPRIELVINLKAGTKFQTGIVKNVYVNPKYIKYETQAQRLAIKKIRSRLKETEMNEYALLAIANDVALIELEGQTWEDINFPKLVEPSSPIGEVNEISISGYGGHYSSWDSDLGEYIDLDDETKVGLQTAQVKIQCASDNSLLDFSYELENIISTNQNIMPFYLFKSKMKHVIEDGKENITFDQGTLISGDSGGPGFVLKESGRLLLTSINSASMDLGVDELKLEIEKNGKVSQHNIEVLESSWGDPNYSALDLREVKKILKTEKLIDKNGALVPGVKLKKMYTQHELNMLTNILFPTNQTFLKQYLPAKTFQAVQ